MKGQKVCGTHGGRAPQSRAAAALRIEREKAEAAVRRLNVSVDVDPQTALLDELHRAVGLEQVLRYEADVQLGQADATIEQVTSGPLYATWRRQAEYVARVASECLRCGIAERQVRLAEQQGALIADLLRKVFDDPELGLSGEQREVLRRVAGRHLRAVAAIGA